MATTAAREADQATASGSHSRLPLSAVLRKLATAGSRSVRVLQRRRLISIPCLCPKSLTL
jgi:hypothetical protein